MSIDLKKFINTYEFDCELPSGRKIKVKPVTTKQMKSLLVYENEVDPYSIEDALDKMMNDCIVTEGVTVDDLYLNDRFYLLMFLRMKSKGNMYEFQYKCPKCGGLTVNSVDLSQLEVTKKPEKTSPFIFNEDLKIEMDHITRAEQKEAITMVNKKGNMGQNQKMTEIAMISYAMCMKNFVTVDEKEQVPLEDAIFFMDNITSGQFSNLKKWFEENNFGVDFTFTLRCIQPNCGLVEEVSIPLESFFS